MVTIGIAESIRLFFNNEAWVAHGVRGISGIPRPFQKYVPAAYYNLFYLALMMVVVALAFVALQRAVKSPWGRTLRAIGEDEVLAQAMGKNVVRFKMEALVLGSMIMGLAGALYAHFIRFISPEVFVPLSGTFLVWVMLIAGGSGSNIGALLGALVIWGLWSLTDLITNLVPVGYAVKAGAIRVIAIAVALEVILLLRPQGLFGQKKTFTTGRRRA